MSRTLSLFDVRPPQGAKPATPPATPPAVDAPPVDTPPEVQRHHHDKRGCDYWLVVLAERTDRAAFEALRSRCKAAGGWYCRKWGSTPGGFAFLAEADAHAFAATLGKPSPPREPSPPRVAWASAGGAEVIDRIRTRARGGADGVKLAERLRTLADRQQATIDAKLAPLAQNWTPKRGREHASRSHDGANLQRAQAALRALADAHAAGTVPPSLEGVTTKKRVLELVATRGDTSGGHYSYRDTLEPRDNSPAGVALRALVEGAKTDAEREAEREAARAAEITRRVDALRGVRVDGFFPTPPTLAAWVVEGAALERGQTVLEPSAGIGSLADAIRDACPDADLWCVEAWGSAAAICDLKRHDVEQADFLAWAAPGGAGYGREFDRVVMNPPFEHGADRRHVLAAWDLVAPGGRLVAIMTPRGADYVAGFLSESQRVEFCEAVRIPPGSFAGADAFHATGVDTMLLTVDRVGGLA